MKNLMLKVFIEILNANLKLVLKSLFKTYHISKISVFGSYIVRWPVRDIAIFFFFLKLSRDNSNLSRDKLKLSPDKMSSYRAINEKI